MKHHPDFQDPPADDAAAAGKGLLGVGVGAGLIGAAMLGLRYFIRPPTKERIPETISPVKFTTHAFQSSRGQMIYHESGTAAGAAVVFIHNVGVGASSYEWSKVYPAFAERHRVLVPDLLGFGESERPKAKLSANDYAASLADFLLALCGEDVQRPVVVGRGLGAGFVALMAAQNPELASRLVLWMPSGRANVPLTLQIASRLPPLNRFIYRNRLARRATIRARFAAKGAFVDPAAVTPEMVEVHAICAQQFQADCAIYRLMQGRMNFDLDARFREILPPVTLLWPELAASHSYAHALRLQSVNRRCALRVIPKVGPFGPLEAPAIVTDVLKDELQGELRVLKAAS
jgi:pimeloyl-ACP methyl ester carboxylesterase